MTHAAVLMNSPRIWEDLWEKTTPERAITLESIYTRIVALSKKIERGLVVDIGGGNGACLSMFKEAGWEQTLVIEHNRTACQQAEANGHKTIQFDLEHSNTSTIKLPAAPAVIVCTEVLEHLTEVTMHAVLGWAKGTGAKCLFSIPNNTWGPDEVQEHARKLTVLQFLTLPMLIDQIYN